MIDELQLFRGRDYKINDSITIRQPTVDEICNYGEQRYYTMVSSLCATPSDYKVQLLDNLKVDYEAVDDFDFFCLISHSYSTEDTAIILGDLDFRLFEIARNEENGDCFLYDPLHRITIDKTIYTLLVNYLRAVHGFKRKIDIGGNEHSKRYLIDKERRQQRYAATQKYESMLVPLVSAMVNCEQFKYDHTTVWQLPIYVFMDSVRRIQKLKNYTQVMQGVYAGTIDLKSISQDSLNWMGSLGEN